MPHKENISGISLSSKKETPPCPFEPMRPSYLLRDSSFYMKLAYNQALKAWEEGEIPVGAVIELGGEIIAQAHNRVEQCGDPTAHAEIMALRKAGKKLGHWNLEGCELYVTKEPCVMCAGAIVLSRIKRVRYGAYDKRFGCAGTVKSLTDDPVFNHRAPAEGGLMECECASMLTEFFRARRVKHPKGDKTEQKTDE